MYCRHESIKQTHVFNETERNDKTMSIDRYTICILYSLYIRVNKYLDKYLCFMHNSFT